MRVTRGHLCLALIASLSAAVISGCSGDGYDDIDLAGDVAEPLKGAGTVVGAVGVIDFVYYASTKKYRCTGSMIARDVVLTAAHCFGPLGAGSTMQSGVVTIDIHYFDPIGGKRPVYSGRATWTAYPTYDADDDGAGSANSDAALIVIPGMFSATDYHDYLRIYSDVDGPLESTLRAYGAGVHNEEFDYDGALRKSDYDVENVDENHIKVDNGPSVGVCHGDSGGPLIKFASRRGVSVPTLVGDLAMMEMDFDGEACVGALPYNDDAFYSRINSAKVSWIQNVTGASCTVASAASNLSYKRCFQLPFIEDVNGEGLDRGVATAIYTTI